MCENARILKDLYQPDLGNFLVSIFIVEYWYNLQEKLRSHHNHEDSGDSQIILAVIVCLCVLVAFVFIVCVFCKCWRKWERIQKEKKNAHQETGYENIPPPGTTIFIKRNMQNCMKTLMLQHNYFYSNTAQVSTSLTGRIKFTTVTI